jgi:hypothetical protein
MWVKVDALDQDRPEYHAGLEQNWPVSPVSWADADGDDTAVADEAA